MLWPDTGRLMRRGVTGGSSICVYSRNGFVPELPKEPVDMIYLCSQQSNRCDGDPRTTEKWVDYAMPTRRYFVRCSL